MNNKLGNNRMLIHGITVVVMGTGGFCWCLDIRTPGSVISNFISSNLTHRQQFPNASSKLVIVYFHYNN